MSAADEVREAAREALIAIEARGGLMIRALNLLDVCTAWHLGMTTTYRAAAGRLRDDILEELKR